MISSLLAGLVLAAQTPAETAEAANPNEAVCRPTGQFSDGQIINIGLSCPAVEIDQDGFVAYLTRMLDAMPEAVDLPQVENVSINDTIRFVHDGSGWRLSEPTPLIRVAPLYPIDSARNGWSGACLTRFTLGEDLRIDIDESVCVRSGGDEPRRTRNFLPETLAALRQFVWLPFPDNAEACGIHRADFDLVNLFARARAEQSEDGEEGEAAPVELPEPVSLIPDPDALLSCA